MNIQDLRYKRMKVAWQGGGFPPPGTSGTMIKFKLCMFRGEIIWLSEGDINFKSYNITNIAAEFTNDIGQYRKVHYNVNTMATSFIGQALVPPPELPQNFNGPSSYHSFSSLNMDTEFIGQILVPNPFPPLSEDGIPQFFTYDNTNIATRFIDQILVPPPIPPKGTNGPVLAVLYDVLNISALFI